MLRRWLTLSITSLSIAVASCNRGGGTAGGGPDATAKNVSPSGLPAKVANVPSAQAKDVPDFVGNTEKYKGKIITQTMMLGGAEPLGNPPKTQLKEMVPGMVRFVNWSAPGKEHDE